jgi:hypothetical protein
MAAVVEQESVVGVADGFRLIPKKRKFTELYVSDPDVGGVATRCYFKVHPHLDPNDPHQYDYASNQASAWLREPEVERYRKALVEQAIQRVRKKLAKAAERALTVLLAGMEGEIRSRLQIDCALQILDRAGVSVVQRTEVDVGERIDTLIKELALRKTNNNGHHEFRQNAETPQELPVSVEVHDRGSIGDSE